MAKVKVVLRFETEVDLTSVGYFDPKETDYPYEDQIADKIVNEDGWDYDDLINGEIDITILTLENGLSNE